MIFQVSDIAVLKNEFKYPLVVKGKAIVLRDPLASSMIRDFNLGPLFLRCSRGEQAWPLFLFLQRNNWTLHLNPQVVDFMCLVGIIASFNKEQLCPAHVNILILGLAFLGFLLKQNLAALGDG